MDSVPVSLDKLTRKIMLLEIERQSLKKEKDEQSKKRLQDIDNELYELKLKESKLKEDFNKEKEANQSILDKKKLLENLKYKLKEAENSYDLDTAARLRHGDIPKLEQELEELRKNTNNTLISDTVSEEDIAQVISKWTNVPISKLVEGEKEKLLKLEENMKQRVIGQDEVLKK
jgi:ATP-dependent Clp protease ATP-binding subunit ClpB